MTINQHVVASRKKMFRPITLQEPIKNRGELQRRITEAIETFDQPSLYRRKNNRHPQKACASWTSSARGAPSNR